MNLQTVLQGVLHDAPFDMFSTCRGSFFLPFSTCRGCQNRSARNQKFPVLAAQTLSLSAWDASGGSSPPPSLAFPAQASSPFPHIDLRSGQARGERRLHLIFRRSRPFTTPSLPTLPPPTLADISPETRKTTKVAGTKTGKKHQSLHR